MSRLTTFITRYCQISIMASPDWDVEFDVDELLS